MSSGLSSVSDEHTFGEGKLLVLYSVTSIITPRPKRECKRVSSQVILVPYCNICSPNHKRALFYLAPDMPTTNAPLWHYHIHHNRPRYLFEVTLADQPLQVSSRESRGWSLIVTQQYTNKSARSRIPICLPRALSSNTDVQLLFTTFSYKRVVNETAKAVESKDHLRASGQSVLQYRSLTVACKS